MSVVGLRNVSREDVVRRLPEICFYVGCLLLVTVRVLDTSMVGKWTNEHHFTNAFVVHRAMILVVIAETIRMWRGEYGKREAVGLAVSTVLGLGAWTLGWHDYTCAIALVFCARNLDIRKVVAVVVTWVSAIVAVIVILSQLGLVWDVVLEKSRGDRHCLGFGYCLYPAQYLFSLTLAMCWLRGKRLTLWEAGLLTVVHVWMYKMTLSRLSFGLGLAAIAFTLLYKFDVHERIPWQRVSRVLRWAFPAMVVVTVVTTALYFVDGASTFLPVINKLVGGRIRLQAEGIRNFGMPLLGQDVSFVGAGFGFDGPSQNGGPIEGYNFVDNLFIHTAIRNGLLFSVGLTAMYTLSSFDAHHRRDVLLVAMLALLAGHCLLDNLVIWMHYNVLVFVFAMLGTKGSVIPLVPDAHPGGNRTEG